MVSLDRYHVTPDGIIYDKTTNLPIKYFKSNKYLQCCIYDENGKHVMGVHNVVAQVYCKDWFEGCVVHHKDNDQHNNRVDNLVCMSSSDHTRQHQTIKYINKVMVCPTCHKEFLWTNEAQSKYYRSNCKEGPYCSQECVKKAIECKPPLNNKKIKCIETGTVYNSITEAAKELRISYSQLWNCVAGRSKSAYGLHFASV